MLRTGLAPLVPWPGASARRAMAAAVVRQATEQSAERPRARTPGDLCRPGPFVYASEGRLSMHARTERSEHLSVTRITQRGNSKRGQRPRRVEEGRRGPDRTDQHRFWSRGGSCCAALLLLSRRLPCRNASDQDYEKRGSTPGSRGHKGMPGQRQGRNARDTPGPQRPESFVCHSTSKPLTMIRNTAGAP